MTKIEFQNHLLSAANNGSLITSKHDPNLLHVQRCKDRSVVSFEVASNVCGFIQSGLFTVMEYENTRYPASPHYMVITPDPASSFSIPGSGVKAFSSTPDVAFDRLIAVSGHNQGWHIYGEAYAKVQAYEVAGILISKGPLI